ncbi:hypothetical protein [Bacillus cereus]|nr:hypothetical protein [Bacillus cereus]
MNRLAVEYHDGKYFIDGHFIAQTPGTFPFTYKMVGKKQKQY